MKFCPRWKAHAPADAAVSPISRAYVGNGLHRVCVNLLHEGWTVLTAAVSSHSCAAQTKCHVCLTHGCPSLITADSAHLPPLNVNISAHFQSKVLKYFPARRQPVSLLGYSLPSSPGCGWGLLGTVWRSALAKTLPPQQSNHNTSFLVLFSFSDQTQYSG